MKSTTRHYLNTLPGSRTETPGIERDYLRRIPTLLFWGSLIPMVLAAAMHFYPFAQVALSAGFDPRMVEIMAVASVVTVWTAALTLTIGCVTVVLMKGPAYVADSYEIVESDSPQK